MIGESRPPASEADRFKRRKLRRPTYVNSYVIMAVNLGVSALPLPNGRVVLSSVPEAIVAGRLTADTGIGLTSWFLPPRIPSTT
jgi:hypothetical protein